MTGKLKALSRTKKILLGVGAFFLLGGLISAVSPQPPVQTTNTKSQTPAVQGAQTNQPNTPSAPQVEVKTETQTVAIPFQTVTQNDSTLASGQTSVIPGVNGEKTVTYQVTYTNGIETSREQVSEVVTKQPVNQVTKVGTKIATPAPSASCTGGYINVDGNCIPSPGDNPVGATAQCNDGTYSYSQHRSGTCSHHGGVAKWL